MSPPRQVIEDPEQGCNSNNNDNNNSTTNDDSQVLLVDVDTFDDPEKAAEQKHKLKKRQKQPSTMSTAMVEDEEEEDVSSLGSSWDGRSASSVGAAVQTPAPPKSAASRPATKAAVSFREDDDRPPERERGRDGEDRPPPGRSPSRGGLSPRPVPHDIPPVVVNPGRLLGMVFGCARWSKRRYRTTLLGCFSSIAVLAIRLILDIKPTAYLIHSVIVFIDMVLIHLFTNQLWLSVSGEIVTITMVIAFHYTKETVWELLETTLLAVLCSFHLINSRNKHMDKEKDLQRDLKTLCRQTSHILQHSIPMDGDSDRGSGGLTRQQSFRYLERMRSEITYWDSERTIEMEPHENDHTQDFELGPSPHVRKARVWGEQFFEHFLDGSAGVMYTSFFGLILDEFIRYGTESKTY